MKIVETQAETQVAKNRLPENRIFRQPLLIY